MKEKNMAKQKRTKNNQMQDVEEILEQMREPRPNYNKKILKLLEKLWNKHPRMRLGALLENYVFKDGERGDKTSQELYYQYDEKTIKRLEQALNENK